MLEEFIGHGTAVVGVMLVPIYTTKFDWFTVDEENAIFQLSVAEANSLLNGAIWS
jgi:hypothetical protein